jgi:hypothetical protein
VAGSIGKELGFLDTRDLGMNLQMVAGVGGKKKGINTIGSFLSSKLFYLLCNNLF